MKYPYLVHRALAVLFVLAFAGSALTERAGAAGLEKTVGWSARYAGVAEAAAADVSGPEAIYFNPAGLAGTPRAAVTVSLSPAFGRSRGQLPTLTTAQRLSASSDRRLVPLGGTLASYPLSRRWGVGVGYYAAAGLQTFYEEIDYRPVIPTATLRPTIKADLEIAEAAFGTAYEIAPGLKVGGAWRIVSVEGAFSSVRILGPNAFQNVFFNDLKDTAHGVRLGVQYQAPDLKWGVGAGWRSQVSFTGRGSVAALVDVGGSVTEVPAGPVSVRNALPQQATLGVFYAVSPTLKILGEYGWTEYSVNRALDVSGSVGGVSLDVVGDVPQRWKNLNVIRVGAEAAAAGGWILRGGYAYASRVTPRESARATFTPPAPVHVFALGAGRRLSRHATLDLATDYTVSTGTGSNVDPNPALSENIAPGSFRSDAVTLRAGVTYAF